MRYEIPVILIQTGSVSIEASSWEEALEKFKEGDDLSGFEPGEVIEDYQLDKEYFLDTVDNGEAQEKGYYSDLIEELGL